MSEKENTVQESVGMNLMTEVKNSDVMRSLVLFLLGVAILGVIVALGWYLAVDLPMQHAAIKTPVNGCWGAFCR
jgi:hypothetical protein